MQVIQRFTASVGVWCPLQANFLLCVGFKCLVALLLLFDSCQIVLGASFQSLFILGQHKT